MCWMLFCVKFIRFLEDLTKFDNNECFVWIVIAVWADQLEGSTLRSPRTALIGGAHFKSNISNSNPKSTIFFERNPMNRCAFDVQKPRRSLIIVQIFPIQPVYDKADWNVLRCLSVLIFWRAEFSKLKIDVVVRWWCPRQKVCVRNGWKLSWGMCERTLEELCVTKCIDRWKCCFIFYFNRIQWVIHLIWWSTKGQGWEPDQNIKSVPDRPSLC